MPLKNIFTAKQICPCCFCGEHGELHIISARQYETIYIFKAIIITNMERLPHVHCEPPLVNIYEKKDHNGNLL